MKGIKNHKPNRMMQTWWSLGILWRGVMLGQKGASFPVSSLTCHQRLSETPWSSSGRPWMWLCPSLSVWNGISTSRSNRHMHSTILSPGLSRFVQKFSLQNSSGIAISSQAAFRTWLLQRDRLYGEELLSTYGNPQSHSGQATTKQTQDRNQHESTTNKTNSLLF